jgi:hypothetical protein
MIELNVAENALGINADGSAYDVSGIIAITDAIPDMGAMTSLNLASNLIGSEGAKHVAEALKVSVLLRLFWYQLYAHLTNGSTAVVCHCPQDMGALSLLNLASNYLCGINAKNQGTYDASGTACFHCHTYSPAHTSVA